MVSSCEQVPCDAVIERPAPEACEFDFGRLTSDRSNLLLVSCAGQLFWDVEEAHLWEGKNGGLCLCYWTDLGLLGYAFMCDCLAEDG
jgi:hypothetical protein